MALWDNTTEIEFFHEALENFACPEQLFYKLKEEYYAYIPKGVSGAGETLQSRNSLIGKFTEKWCKKLFEPIAKELGLFAINGVVCEELGLNKKSSADLAFCTRNTITQNPFDIKLIFEVKMSIVSNYRYLPPKIIEYVGDYKQRKGNPSLLRSDSMLKAIGKAVNIRVSGVAQGIPIIVLGNSPITENYISKVDFLKTAGVVQGFWSLNPKPTTSDFIFQTPQLGFRTILEEKELFVYCKELVSSSLCYFSAMLSRAQLGELIDIASQEPTSIAKAQKFLRLIQNIK
ncbi:MAG: hypothetical protein NZ576_00290 [Bacteroidia bacterium]|nr:hypothetical protein [Bacteroidia bacterium]